MSGLSSSSVPSAAPGAVDLVKLADAAERGGDLFEAIDRLTRADREHPDAVLEHRLVSMRHRAFERLDPTPGFATWPPAPADGAGGPGGTIPEVAPSELTADVLRHHIITDGCVLVRGLADAPTVEMLVDGIDRALNEWAGLRRPFLRATGSPWFDPLEIDEPARSALGRTWVTNSGGLLTADSPRMLFLLLEALEEAGMREVVHGYLGERPALSANKCTLRRVQVDTNSAAGTRTARSSDRASVPSTSGSRSRSAASMRPDSTWCPGASITSSRPARGGLLRLGGRPRCRRIARAGDADRSSRSSMPATLLIFDDLFLHRTAVEPEHDRTALRNRDVVLRAVRVPGGARPARLVIERPVASAHPPQEPARVERERVLLHRRGRRRTRRGWSRICFTASAGPGRSRPHRVAVHDRVGDDDVGADRHERRVGLELPRPSWRGRRTSRGRRAPAPSPTSVAHRGDGRGVVRPPRAGSGAGGAPGRSSARLVVDRQHLAVADELADRREEERAAAVAGAGLDDPVGPDRATISSWYANRSVGAVAIAAAEPGRAASTAGCARPPR